MRALALVALSSAALVAAAQTPRREGTYSPAGGQSVSWRIDERHTLVWGDARYTPVGARVEGTPAAVDAANAAGIKDLLIDLPLTGGAWETTVAEAEKNGQRYLIRIASLAPGAAGVSVDPASYRVAGLTGSHHIDLSLPSATSALVAVAGQRDKANLGTTVVPTPEGHLVMDTKVNAGLQNVVLIYPRTDRTSLVDLWEGFDSVRDTLLARLRGTPFGAGFRGIVNPIGSTILPGQSVHGVPTSEAFQVELAAVLEKKHTTVDGAMKAWALGASSLSTSVTTGIGGKTTQQTRFMDIARLVPLWADGRGVYTMWDPKTDRTYGCDERSRAWEDIQEAIQGAASRRFARLCASIHRVVDVPVVQEWTGWAGATDQSAPPFDGLATRASGDATSELLDSAARAVSSVARWNTRGWLLATDVEASPKSLQAALDGIADIGVRAAFLDGALPDIAALASRRASAPPEDVAVAPLFFPENAANPAAVQRLPGGRIWLPTPESGNRLDLGDDFFGYRIDTPKGNRVVMWARTPGRYLLRMVKPLDTTITSMDATPPEPKAGKNGLTVTMGQLPLVIEGTEEIPVPDLAVRQTLDAFIRLKALSDQGRHVGTDEVLAFTQAAEALDFNPGGSFLAMRQQLRRFASLLSPLTWLEAERTDDSTFSGIAALPGASGDRALVLRSALPSDEGFSASYKVNVQNRDEVDLWIAARLSPERRKELEVAIGGSMLYASEPPVSSYGDGFAWYHLGKTRLTGGVANVTLRMHSPPGAEAAIDVLVFAPASWRPNGLAYPYSLVIPPSTKL